MNADARWMKAALELARRGRGRTSPNPAVGCILVKHDILVGRGWTQAGGRPHAEAAALDMAGEAAHGATVYVTLEPCAHRSERGPACADLLANSGVAEAVVAMRDPDPRTAGRGIERMEAAGIVMRTGLLEAEARAANAGFFTRMILGRPRITLKLAMSIDGRVAMQGGESQWITGPTARSHAHMERAFADVILVGRGTLEADDPALDVRIPGLEAQSPRPAVMSATLSEIAPQAKIASRDPILLRATGELVTLGVNDVLVEGGTGTASMLLAEDLVDRLLVYRAPIILGDPAPGVGRLGLDRLASAHGRWTLAATRALGSDRLDVYERTR